MSYDPDRGEIVLEHVQIEPPTIKIFQSTEELSYVEEEGQTRTADGATGEEEEEKIETSIEKPSGCR